LGAAEFAFEIAQDLAVAAVFGSGFHEAMQPAMVIVSDVNGSH
jgi:hypothetical protein